MSVGSEHDLLAVIKFKNLRLWNALEGRTVKLVAQEADISPNSLSNFLTLKEKPYTWKRDVLTLRESARKLAEYLQIPVPELFPETLYDLKIPAFITRTYASQEFKTLGEAKHIAALPPYLEDEFSTPDEQAKAIKDVLRMLKPREELAIKMWFGLEGYEKATLEEIGHSLGVTRSRAAQIISRGFRSLRHPKLSKFLRELRLP